jgi:glycosyltransferase involved in cell wall biosynthesis
MINWSDPVAGALNGGGVNGYARHLALALAWRGHRVGWLSSGRTYTPDHRTNLPGPCEVRRMPEHEGLEVYEVINSPVAAPGIFQFGEPVAEIESPVLAREVARFAALWRPDVVHWHNVEGFSADCIDAVAGSRPPSMGPSQIFSLHNYHTICPQVYLMQRGVHVCTDYRNGHACVSCVDSCVPEFERRRRAGLGERWMPPPIPTTPHTPPHAETRAPLVRGVVLRLAMGLTRRARKLVHGAPVPPQPAAQGLPGSAVRGEADIAATHSARPLISREAQSVSQEPVENVAHPEPASGLPPNAYAQRRAAMVRAMAVCDRVLAVSRFVEAKFAALGVPAEKITTVHIGSAMTTLAAQASRTPLAAHDGRRPVRLVFMGYNNAYKGLPMLLDSLDLLSPEHLARLHLYIWAKDIERDMGRLWAFETRLGGLSVRGSYRYEEIPAMLAGKDAGIVPSIWWDNGPQTVMEFLACGLPVIGADLGGIPDFIEHGRNGLLFRGNDRPALAALLGDIAARPQILDELRAGVQPPKDMRTHALEVEEIYESCRKARA